MGSEVSSLWEPRMVVDILQCLLGWCFSLVIYILIFLLVCFLFKEFTMGIYRPPTSASLKGKVVVITGGNAGVGFETAKSIASQGARLVLACRSREKGEKAVKNIIESTGNTQVVFRMLDLQDLKSVRSFAENIIREEEKIDILINNAGMSDDRGASSWANGGSHLSKDGLEIVTQTNHLSHFLLTNLVKDLLVRAGKSRVVNVSSHANIGGNIDLTNINYETNHQPEKLARSYHNSKLMNLMFSSELTKRWGNLGVTSYSCHPGFVRSGFFNNFRKSVKSVVEVLGLI